jgi:large subunit ribosomal protein L4
MKIPIFNLEAQKLGQTTLPLKIFSAPLYPRLEAQAIRVYLANQRQAHAKTKHRNEFAGTTRKMWSQKGTGRARHGSAKAPIFVGGGSAHGPRGDRNYKLSLSKNQKKLALRSILSRFAQGQCLLVIDHLSKLPPKTKAAQTLLNKLADTNQLLDSSHKIAIITSANLPNIKRAFANLPGIKLLCLRSLNTYHLANQNFLIFSRRAIKHLNQL